MPTPSSPVCAHPSDVALIKDFLRPWVASGAVKSSGFVHAADLYSAEPQELTQRYPAAVAPDGERAWYFLTRLRNKSPRGRRKARVAGQGWWHGEAGPKDVVDALNCNRILGQRQSFSFMRRTGRNGMPERTGWIMVEHHLRDQGLGAQVEGLVLCKVYRSPRHHHDDDDDDGVWCSAATSLLLHAAVAAAARPSGCKRKAADHEVHDSSNAATPRENPDGEVSGGAATAAPALGLEKKAVAADDEDSSARTPTPKKMKAAAAGNDEDSSAPPPAPKKMMEAAAAAAADDEDSSAPPHAPKKMKAAAATVYYEDSSSPPSAPKKMKSVAATDDDESSGAESADNGRESSDSPAAAVAAVLHCPQCGFHLGALQAFVTTATAAGIAQVVYAPAHQGDSGKDHHFVHQFMR